MLVLTYTIISIYYKLNLRSNLMKESILSSFIKYLKSRLKRHAMIATGNLVQEDSTSLIGKEYDSKFPIPRGKSNRKESKLDLHRGEIIKALDNGASKASIARKYGVSAVNLHYWIQRRKIKISKKR